MKNFCIHGPYDMLGNSFGVNQFVAMAHNGGIPCRGINPDKSEEQKKQGGRNMKLGAKSLAKASQETTALRSPDSPPVEAPPLSPEILATLPRVMLFLKFLQLAIASCEMKNPQKTGTICPQRFHSAMNQYRPKGKGKSKSRRESNVLKLSRQRNCKTSKAAGN